MPNWNHVSDLQLAGNCKCQPGIMFLEGNWQETANGILESCFWTVISRKLQMGTWNHLSGLYSQETANGNLESSFWTVIGRKLQMPNWNHVSGLYSQETANPKHVVM